jgi:hypothetical protein
MASPAAVALEALLQPGERVADFSGLLDPKRCTCAMTSRERAIKFALGATVDQREAEGTDKRISSPTTAKIEGQRPVQMRFDFPPLEIGPDELDPGYITPWRAA